MGEYRYILLTEVPRGYNFRCNTSWDEFKKGKRISEELGDEIKGSYVIKEEQISLFFKTWGRCKGDLEKFNLQIKEMLRDIGTLV